MKAYDNNPTLKLKAYGESASALKVSSGDCYIDLRAVSDSGDVIHGRLIENHTLIPMKSDIKIITDGGHSGETYEGPYSVDPLFQTTILETRRKFMTDNVRVHPIGVSRVTNLSGGKTVYIGGAINGS